MSQGILNLFLFNRGGRKELTQRSQRDLFIFEILSYGLNIVDYCTVI